MAGSDTAMMKQADTATRRLMARVTDFLCAHHLPPSPANFAFAYGLVSNPDGSLARAVAAIADGGVRLTQADLARLGGPVEGDAARQLAQNQALIARTHAQVEGFETIVRDMRDETGQFGDDLAAGAAAIRSGGAVRIDEVVEIAGAMVNRVRSAERRLAAATSEASELRQKLQEARDNARRDPLTALPNRRALEESYATAAASREAMVFAVCDIDNFKSFNDTFGHQAGDEVLRSVAAALRRVVRRSDVLARYGGEEFCLVVPHATSETLAAAGERLRATIETHEVDLGPQGRRHVTASFGCALLAGVTSPDDAARLVAAADIELYGAKRAGRNRVSIAAEPVVTA